METRIDLERRKEGRLGVVPGGRYPSKGLTGSGRGGGGKMGYGKGTCPR